MRTKLIYLLLISTLFGFKSHSNAITAVGSDIIGIWFNEEKTVKVNIYFSPQSQKYNGKVEWLKEPNDEKGNPKKDPLNPNPNLRDRSRMGMVILTGFVFNEKEAQWEGGNIYDPKNGKTYNGYVKMENRDKMNLRGYVAGMTWIGRTAVWERVK